jgi:LysM repeat protein
MICNTYSQDKSYTKHTVGNGETVFQIAQKYNVTAKDIYDLNPDSKNGIQKDMILIIPKSGSKTIVNGSKTIKNSPKNHEVLQKETLYGIARQYGITVGDLKISNPILETQSINIGQIIIIPYIKGAVESKIKTNQQTNKNSIKSNKLTNYEVQSKETLYGLSKKFNITIDELILLNPELENGVQEAMTIKVPENEKNYDDVKTNNLQNHNNTTTFSKPDKIVPKTDYSKPIEKLKNKNISDLKNTINQNIRRKLTLLLPFNVSKIQNDTVVSLQERIKNNKFLNMTLDFYSGALMAIDSAKNLGLNIDVTILDSQETKNASNIDNLITEANLRNQDAIIGPFYQNQADRLAGLLENFEVPVISPLSKDQGKPYSNSYTSMPSNDLLKTAMFDYMTQKNGNIIAVIDSKKATLKQYIIDNQSAVKFAEFNEKGVLSTESLKSLLLKDKINYVVFASEKTGMVFSVTNTLLNALPNYQIRLVILEPNPTFDFEEISLNRLTKLKLTYPSLSKENESNEGRIFEKEFKKKNKIFPNQFATRGFDLTFDTLMRLSQGKSFNETTNLSTEQIENKFDYQAKNEGGFENKGIYIMQYNNDLTITEAQ